MTIEKFLFFLACLLFSLFNLYWQPRFTYQNLRWIPFILVAAGVLGAAYLLVS